MNNLRRPICFRQTTWTVALLAISFLLTQPGRVEAQQWTTHSNGVDIFTINPAAKVGIGTTAPLAKLDVRYDAAFGFPTPGLTTGSLHIVPTTGTKDNSLAITFGANDGNLGVDVRTNAQAGIYVQSSGNYGTKMYFATSNNFALGAQARMMIDPFGNVGIGTTNPVRLLHIGANNSVGGIRVEGPLAGGTGLFSFSMGGVGSFGIDAPNVVGGRLIVKEDGKVGIGTAVPSTALHVVGDLTLTGTGNISAAGNIAARYQDLAEWVPASHAISAGTVVVLDAEQSNHVLASTRAYDTSVAGVVSAHPGVLLGEKGEGKVMVATTGRVRVKVDATNAPIRVGDLLVTSDKEGIAMRSQPLDLGGTPIHRPGTLIGKALEPLEKGVGEILVLLSLQ